MIEIGKIKKCVREVALVVFVFLLLASTLYFTGALRNDEAVIKDELTRRGYSVDGVEFVRDSSQRFRVIYTSSEPIALNNNTECDQWQITTWGTSGVSRFVSPYPHGTFPASKAITIQFTPSEYEKLVDDAGDTDVLEYIKEKALE